MSGSTLTEVVQQQLELGDPKVHHGSPRVDVGLAG